MARKRRSILDKLFDYGKRSWPSFAADTRKLDWASPHRVREISNTNIEIAHPNMNTAAAKVPIIAMCCVLGTNPVSRCLVQLRYRSHSQMIIEAIAANEKNSGRG